MIYVYIKTPKYAWLQVPTEEIVGALGPFSVIGPIWSYLEKHSGGDLFTEHYKLTTDNLKYMMEESEIEYLTDEEFEYYQEMHKVLNETTSEVE